MNEQQLYHAQLLAMFAAAQGRMCPPAISSFYPQLNWMTMSPEELMFWGGISAQMIQQNNMLTQHQNQQQQQQQQMQQQGQEMESFEEALNKIFPSGTKLSPSTNGGAPQATGKNARKSDHHGSSSSARSSRRFDDSIPSTSSSHGNNAPQSIQLRLSEIRKNREKNYRVKKEQQSGAVTAPINDNVSLNANLIEASARCWSAMANQLTRNLQQNELLRAFVQNAVNHEKARNRSTNSTKKSPHTPQNHINSASTSRKTADAPTVSRSALDAPLDLSSHKVVGRTDEPLGDDRLSTSSEQTIGDNNTESHRKRSQADAVNVRVPLTFGWRRQTCIRSISASGVRGDVIYYAPCGKRFGSYAEVMRYLNKQKIKDIGREHFSFSCKIIVGEYVIIKNGDNGNKIMDRVSEDQVLAKMALMSNNNSSGSRKLSVSAPKKPSDDGASKTSEPCTNDKNAQNAADEMAIQYLQQQIMQMHGEQLYSQYMLGLGQQQQKQEKQHPKPSSLHHQPQEVEQHKQEHQAKKIKLEASTSEMQVGEPEVKKPRLENVVETTPAQSNEMAASNVEEKIKSKTEEEERHKVLRQPTDDLNIEEARRFPTLDRIQNLTVKGSAFADALMVDEFIHNFGHVLKIDKKLLPTIGEFLAGLQNDPKHLKDFLMVTKILLQLVLEYPGLPSGITGRTPLGQAFKDVGLNRENYSELLHMFLMSRDEEGKKLGIKLQMRPFEYLDMESKAAILAFLCNELLYCRNIVREIESNLDEMTRLKGEKWLREGKSRALRGVQARKRVALKKARKVCQTKQEEDAETSRTDSPGSEHSTASEEVAATPPPVSKLKALTPGLGQCDILTPEEEEMSVEDLDDYIAKLNTEAEELRDKHNSMTSRVRIQPVGQDRFHRYYWCLPRIGSLLVESIESAGSNNPAVNIDESCQMDPASISLDVHIYIDPDIIACIEDLIDEICGEEERPGKSKKSRLRKLDNKCKRGWWQISNEQQLEKVRIACHGRGIRERVLQRYLNKDSYDFNSSKQVKLVAIERSLTEVEINKAMIQRLTTLISTFEQKVVAANVHCKPFSSMIEGSEDDFESEDSQDGWNFDENYESSVDADDGQSLIEWKAFNNLKTRLLEIESCIERRYLLHRYHAGSCIPIERILGTADKEGSSIADSTSVTDSEAHSDACEVVNVLNGQCESAAITSDESGDTELMHRWRNYVNDARTGGQLMFGLQASFSLSALDSAIAWERSIMKACCQICRTSENESQLLLCDACDLGYHMYCFRPRIAQVPDGEWFCPLCIQRACRKVICLLCTNQKSQNEPISVCTKCYNGYHVSCFDRTPTITDSKQWTCPGCLSADGFSNDLESLLHNDDVEPSQSIASKNGNMGETSTAQQETSIKLDSSKQKRRSTPADYNFPPDMMKNLFKTMLDEIWAKSESEPFRFPVDAKQVPLYRKVIKKPMDLNQIRTNIENDKYATQEGFIDDIELVFENCRTFNEDESEIGKLGETLRKFYNKRWKQLRYNFSKRLKRLKHPRLSPPAPSN